MNREVPELSVVMATFNRSETIQRTLRCLAKQDLEPHRYELIVVDDGSTDATESVIEQLSREMPCRMHYLRHENQGPGYTQNRGINLASGRVLMLMADDIWMEPQTLRRHLEFHPEEGAENTALLGSVLQCPELNQTVYLRNWDPHRCGEIESGSELPYYMFWACNVSLKLDFMKKYGMFRDKAGWAGAAAHEDPEVGYRLMTRGGMRLFFDAEARGHHYHLEVFDTTLGRMYQRGLNFGQFRKLVNQPEVSVAYHVLSRSTLRDHLETYTSDRIRYLGPKERSPSRMARHYLLRGLAFNRLTVTAFWLPFLRLSEKSAFLERFVWPEMFHAVLAYYFQRGAARGTRQFRRATRKAEEAT